MFKGLNKKGILHFPLGEVLGKLLDRWFHRKLSPMAAAKLMKKDSILPDKITALDNLTPPSEAKSIFLIGATGIVGPYLLHHLLQTTQADIYCLMHHRHGDQAKTDLINQLKRNGLDKQLDDSRIHIVHGDIAKKNLGLTRKIYRFLAKNIDIIFHNAAWTNHIRPYAVPDEEKPDLRKTNTLALKRTLILATTEKAKLVNFTSTLAAVNRLDASGCLVETLPTPDNQGEKLNVGYLQSKFVAEKLIFQAIQRGIPCRVFRLGEITGDSQTGNQQAEKDHMMLELKACVQMGIAPNWQDSRSFIPADIAGAIISTIGLQNHAENGAYNINNPHLVSWSEIVSALNRFGHHVDIVPEEKWVAALKKADSTNALYLLRDVYKTSQALLELMPALFLMFGNKVCCKRTMAALSKTKITFPESRDLLEKYLAYFNDSGFF